MTTTRQELLKAELEAIRAERGVLIPQYVVEAARPQSSPLHRFFEWDDEKAAEQHRVETARGLIRSVRIQYREPTEDEAALMGRGYLSVRTPQGPAPRAYEPAEVVAADPVLRQVQLQEMRRDWLTFKRRWQDFAEFAPLVAGDPDVVAAVAERQEAA